MPTRRQDRKLGRRFAVSRRRAMTLALVFTPSWAAALVVAAFILTLHDQGSDREHIWADVQLHPPPAQQRKP
jgi:hypothetical protein